MAHLSFPQRVGLVLFLAVVLAAPAAMGAQSRPRAEIRQTGFVTAVVSMLREQFWSLFTGSSWEKEGCKLDPHGGCISGSTTLQEDAGCVIDPHGGCGH